MWGCTLSTWAAEKTKVTLQRVPLYITKDHLFFFWPSLKRSRMSVKSKASIATKDFEVMVTLIRKNFTDIHNVLTCGGRPIWRSSCAAGHLSKSYPEKRPAPQTPTIYKQGKHSDRENHKTLQRPRRMAGYFKEEIKGCNPAPSTGCPTWEGGKEVGPQKHNNKSVSRRCQSMVNRSNNMIISSSSNSITIISSSYNLSRITNKNISWCSIKISRTSSINSISSIS